MSKFKVLVPELHVQENFVEADNEDAAMDQVIDGNTVEGNLEFETADVEAMEMSTWTVSEVSDKEYDEALAAEAANLVRSALSKGRVDRVKAVLNAWEECCEEEADAAHGVLEGRHIKQRREVIGEVVETAIALLQDEFREECVEEPLKGDS